MLQGPKQSFQLPPRHMWRSNELYQPGSPVFASIFKSLACSVKAYVPAGSQTSAFYKSVEKAFRLKHVVHSVLAKSPLFDQFPIKLRERSHSSERKQEEYRHCQSIFFPQHLHLGNSLSKLLTISIDYKHSCRQIS